ncbi:unnamed protein product [Didymodactylos carnosus]|uniref:C2 domain-containing protein n=1 Tax=Didymodactylos carnosus TaxID=1234261 RepID=A0A8S2FMS7_9BILA|nr:unnamed protein product [Didymodactylos carnosus]CAF4303297.1 unnamed protein product [Didymodactylos carnosus]
MSHPHGQLNVTIVEGRKLKDEDAIGKNDAYIELYVNKDYRQRTSTRKNMNNPIWNETFSFNLLKHYDNLHLHAYDDDIVGQDSIGSCKIDLNKHVFGKGVYDDWVKLPAHLGLGSHGEIHVIIQHIVQPF